LAELNAVGIAGRQSNHSPDLMHSCGSFQPQRGLVGGIVSVVVEHAAAQYRHQL
jgi:hypothetical protein